MWVGKEKSSLEQLEKDISKGSSQTCWSLTEQSALKLCWIKRLVEDSGNWQKLFEAMLGLNKKYLRQLVQQSLLDLEK